MKNGVRFTSFGHGVWLRRNDSNSSGDNMKFLRTMLVTALMLVAFAPAHAGKMTKSNAPVVVEEGKATIVFMRPGKFVGAAVAVPVFDVTSEESKFVGLVEAGSKVAYSVPAGEHLFMTTVFGGDAGVRFYKAQVEAGKTYYFRARIIQGIWGLEPVRGSMLDSNEFKSWDRSTDLTVNSPKTIAWSEENKASVDQKRILETKVVSDDKTLLVEDGR